MDDESLESDESEERLCLSLLCWPQESRLHVTPHLYPFLDLGLTVLRVRAKSIVYHRPDKGPAKGFSCII